MVFGSGNDSFVIAGCRIDRKTEKSHASSAIKRNIRQFAFETIAFIFSDFSPMAFVFCRSRSRVRRPPASRQTNPPGFYSLNVFAEAAAETMFRFCNNSKGPPDSRFFASVSDSPCRVASSYSVFCSPGRSVHRFVNYTVGVPFEPVSPILSHEAICGQWSMQQRREKCDNAKKNILQNSNKGYTLAKQTR